MKKDRARRAVSGAFALALSLPFACGAQGDPGYPSKPIKVVVPAPREAPTTCWYAGSPSNWHPGWASP